MIRHANEVMPLPNYRLFLRFNAGESGQVNLADELEGDVLGAVRDPALFATATRPPAMRNATWANGADLAPEFLLELLRGRGGQKVA